MRSLSTVIPLPVSPTLRKVPDLQRLSPDDMLLFAAVARSGGIRSAAEVLHTPRSTVSRRLAELEKSLGARLIARSTRRFALTELGTALYEKCTQLEDLLRSTEDVTARAAREPTGLMRVAASPIVGEEFLPEVVDEYLRRFPRVRLQVELAVDFVDLSRGNVDLAIRTGPLAEKGDLYATRLGVSVKGHYASPEYLEKHGAPLVPEDLTSHDCIVVGAGSRQAVWEMRSRTAEVHIGVSGRLRVDNHRLARSAAAKGLGIARVPTVFARSLVEEGRLIPVLEKYWPRGELFAVHTSGQPAPPKIRAFIDLLRTAMKRHLPER